MSKHHDNAPMPLADPPAVVDQDLEPLLAAPFAQAWEQAPEPTAAAGVRQRLAARLASSRAAEAPMLTRRRRGTPADALAAGVRAQTLYVAEAGRTLRPGEPLRVRLIELDGAASLAPGALPADRHREILVLAGGITVSGEALSLRDYHLVPAGHPSPPIASDHGALVFVRESALVDAGPPRTVRDAEAGWPDFAPGIRRRVLWSGNGEAALLYHADAGAAVPAHSHGHDEECLMVQGELFLDDLLLQGGDWQLAPAGTGHRITATDTGVVIYAHGDLDLRFVA